LIREGLSGKTILVTGATGCIGGRLVERLINVERAHVKALVRNPARAVRIARLPVDFVFGDILDLQAVKRAVADCQIVIHCAYGNSGDTVSQRRVTVQGTENTLRVALTNGAERFVHVSTVAIHGLDPGEEIDETAPYHCDESDVYAASKIEAEELVWAIYHDHGLPVAVIRPTIVYGPYSWYWTIIPIQRLKAGNFHLVEDGQGICQPMYVDDVVQALVLAGTHPAAVGEAFIIANEAVTWKQFFGYYMRMTDVCQIQSWDFATWRARQFEQRVLKTSLGKAISYLGSPRLREVARELPLTNVAYRLVSKTLSDRLKKKIMSQPERLYRARRWPVKLPDEREMIQFSSRCIYSTRKAEEMLGYRPAISLDEGMERTENWLRYVGWLE